MRAAHLLLPNQMRHQRFAASESNRATGICNPCSNRFATRVNLQGSNKNTMLKECAIGWKARRAERCAYSKLHHPQRCPHKQGTRYFPRLVPCKPDSPLFSLAASGCVTTTGFKPGFGRAFFVLSASRRESDHGLQSRLAALRNGRRIRCRSTRLSGF